MHEPLAKDRPTTESYYGRAIPQSLAARAVDFTELAVIDLAPLFGGDPGRATRLYRVAAHGLHQRGIFLCAQPRGPRSNGWAHVCHRARILRPSGGGEEPDPEIEDHRFWRLLADCSISTSAIRRGRASQRRST